MERDIKFEIQFLLSLTLVIFGALSIRTLREPMNQWVAYFLVFLLSIHFSIFNIFYGLGQVLPFRIDFVESVKRLSWPILFLTSLIFVFWIVHSTFALIYTHTMQGTSFTSTARQMTILYLVPILIVGVMGYGLKNYVLEPFSNYKNVNIKVVPKFIRVFDSKEDTRPLSVKIENVGEEQLEYDVEIEFPEEIEAEVGGDLLNTHYTHSGNLAPNHAYRENFELWHDTRERGSDLIIVTVKFPGGSKTFEVEIEVDT